MSQPIWTKPEIVFWSQTLLDSYKKLIGDELIERKGNLLKQAKNLFLVPFVVVSHGTQEDPILNYGNQKALELWETTWEALTQTSSRLTAESSYQGERQQMLIQVAKQGFVQNYRGVRYSKTGKRFLMKQATVWTVLDSEGQHCGQAATFAQWSYWKE